MTSGGTGFAKRDVTTEATRALITPAESLMIYLQTEALKITPMACLSNGLIGFTSNDSLVINLPGKPKAVAENMEILLRNGIIIHAV